MEAKIRYLLSHIEKVLAEREVSFEDDAPYYQGYTEGLTHGMHLVKCALLAQSVEELRAKPAERSSDGSNPDHRGKDCQSATDEKA